MPGEHKVDRDSSGGASGNGPVDRVPGWQRKVWVYCALSLMVLIAGLVVLVGKVLWALLDLLRPVPPDNSFVFAGMTLLNSSLLRLLAILIGGAIAFAGLAVSFFAHQQATSMNAEVATEQLLNAKAAMATSSPGIVGVVVGAIVIVIALFLRGAHTYGAPDSRPIVLPRALPAREELLRGDTHKPEPAVAPKAASSKEAISEK